jgi:hypothetical protein
MENTNNLYKDDFIKAFGPLEEKVLWGAGDADYQMVLKILGGSFYTHGFFPSYEDPFRENLPWSDLKAAMEFCVEVVQILNDGGCTSLNSAGDRRYYPFVCYDEKLPYVPNFTLKINKNVPGTEAKGFMLTERSCIFWGKGREAEYKEYLEAKTIKAFKQAGKRMKETLKDRLEFAIVDAPYRTELPVLIGGKFTPHIFAGLITTRINKEEMEC